MIYNFIACLRELFSNPKNSCKLCFRKLIAGHPSRRPSKNFPEICQECYIAEGSRIRYNNRHRRNRRNPTGKLSIQNWLSVLRDYAWCCAYCEARGRHQLSIDHIESLSAGGTNTIKNVQPLCLKCHAGKDGHVKRPFSKLRRRYREFRMYIWYNFKISLPRWDKR